MKARLLHEDQDFDFGADLPPNHKELIQDLEMGRVLDSMALGDKFLFDVSSKVVLASLDDPDAILYRQPRPRGLHRSAGDREGDVRHRGGRARGQARNLGVQLANSLVHSFWRGQSTSSRRRSPQATAQDRR